MKSFEERKNNIEQFVLSEFYVPMKEKELAIMLQVSSEDRPEFKRALEELLSENRLQITKRGRYIKPEQKVLTGTFISNAKGFGFVEVEGSTEDYYIPENRVNGAFHQDTVSIRLLPGQRGKRQEAEVVSIVCRSIETVVGTYQKSKNFGFVIPDNTKMAQDIFIAKEHTNGAVDGHKVVVRLTSYGGPDKNPEGIITEILGHINDPGVDILSIVKGFDLPMEFTEKQLKQAERASRDVSEADREGRLDLRDVMMVTIDGEDAKDLDDGVYVVLAHHLAYGVHVCNVEISGFHAFHLVHVGEEIVVCGVLAHDSHLVAELSVGSCH